ncbi:MAG: hypothetical protein LBM12_02410 [Candidatus Nomurabacteria bacterium]|jgi:hypothetical protein|nr:hypothetical protein [Candidatus Nomurabacteria bacterium]
MKKTLNPLKNDWMLKRIEAKLEEFYALPPAEQEALCTMSPEDADRLLEISVIDDQYNRSKTAAIASALATVAVPVILFLGTPKLPVAIIATLVWLLACGSATVATTADAIKFNKHSKQLRYELYNA